MKSIIDVIERYIEIVFGGVSPCNSKFEPGRVRSRMRKWLGRGWEKEVKEGRERTFFSWPPLSLFCHLTLVQLSCGCINLLPAPPTEPKLLVVYLWNSAKIVVLGPYLCIRLWGTDLWLACSKSHRRGKFKTHFQ